MDDSSKVSLTKRERVALNRQRAHEIKEACANMSEQRKIFIDCSFGSVMDESERSSLTLQIQECYSHLRRYGNGTTQMFVTSVSEEIHSSLKKKGGDQWAFHSTPEAVEDVSKSLDCDAIFLSPDAIEELTFDELKSVNGFIIGGIVDRKVSRNETAHKAIRINTRSRRLPIDSHKCRNKVFNIDTVFKFLLKGFSDEVNDHQSMLSMLQATLPDRKQIRESIKIKCEPVSRFSIPSLGNQRKLEHYSVIELFR